MITLSTGYRRIVKTLLVLWLGITIEILYSLSLPNAYFLTFSLTSHLLAALCKVSLCSLLQQRLLNREQGYRGPFFWLLIFLSLSCGGEGRTWTYARDLGVHDVLFEGPCPQSLGTMEEEVAQRESKNLKS